MSSFEMKLDDGTIVNVRQDGFFWIRLDDGMIKYIDAERDKEWISDGKPVYKVQGKELDVLIYEDGCIEYDGPPKVDRTHLYYDRPCWVPLPVYLANYYHNQEGGTVIPLTDHYGPLEDYYPTEEEITAANASGVLI
jgi:hypothetical protein